MCSCILAHSGHCQPAALEKVRKEDTKIIYHAGDTDFIPEMRTLINVDMALLPTGNKYTIDNSEAAEAAVIINPKIVISMHRWDTDPEEFRKKVETHSTVKVVILHEGKASREVQAENKWGIS